MKAVMTACLSVAFGTQIAVNRPCTIEETSGFAVVSDQLIACLIITYCDHICQKAFYSCIIA